MKLVVITNATLKSELLSNGSLPGADEIVFTESPQWQKADVYIDLLFEPTTERISLLEQSSPMVIVNAVAVEPTSLPRDFVRINGWPGFLKRKIIEAAAEESVKKELIATVFERFNKEIAWTDVAGFITPRIVSMIINEAFYVLEEQLSTPEEIDIAMKLGTNYPYGPFEWAGMIGVKEIYKLLSMLGKTESRYLPGALLTKQALSS